MKTIQEWIEEELKKRDWKPSELAKRSGLSPTAISNILNYNRNPSLDTLKQLAQGFNIPLARLLENTGIISPRKINETDEIFLHLLHQLPESDQKRILIILKAFNEERGKNSDVENFTRGIKK